MMDIQISENDSKNLEKALHTEMDKALKHLDHELVKIRTGRAHTSLVEDLVVSTYGGTTESTLKSLAVLTAPEPKMIVIQPWDKGTIADIEKAILNSDLGLTPASEGEIIRLRLPDMSGQRREELVKLLHKKIEECRIAIRNIRKEFNNFVRDCEKAKKLSENTSRRLTDLIQKFTDDLIKKAEALGEKKEKEIKSF